MPRIDDELPYDELDPCCQREIDDNRRNQRIKSELRRFDRSNHRLDLKQAVLGNTRVRTRCECCNVPRDYPLLAEARDRLMKSKEDSQAFADSNTESEEEEQDEFEFLMNESMTPYEIERLNAVNELKSKLQFAESYGYGIHREDTAGHLLRMIEDKEYLVCHVFDPSSVSCASLDLVLEDLARKFLGTRFRRISLSDAGPLQAHFKIQKMEVILICFGSGSLIHSSPIRIFGAGGDIYPRDVETFLEHSHVLSSEMIVPMLKQNDEGEELAVEKYCDEPGCYRPFAHEHVGTSSSLLSSSEALAPNRMQSL